MGAGVWRCFFSDGMGRRGWGARPQRGGVFGTCG